MEEHTLGLLQATQSPHGPTRKNAETELDSLKSNDEFAMTLVRLGARQDIAIGERLSALIVLKKTVRYAWSEAQEDYEEDPLLQATTKAQIRNDLLHIVFTAQESRITSNAANAIAQIANSDYPEDWPDLLKTVLEQISHSGDDQTHAILVVIDELLSGGLDENSFYTSAGPILEALYQIVTDNNKKLNVRSHGISIFRKCFDFVENLKDKDEEGITGFVNNVCLQWGPFLLQVIQEALPAQPSLDDESGDTEVCRNWRGVVALKTQVVMTLARIQYITPGVLPTRQFLDACWTSLQSLAHSYFDFYVEGERQGSLMDQYNLPYTLDMLVTEYIDYLTTLLRSQEIQSQMTGMLESDRANGTQTAATWLSEVLRSMVTFSSITTEAESIWELDYNCFLSDEVYAESNSTARTMCAGLMAALSFNFPQETLEGMVSYSEALVQQGHAQSWRTREAALFMLQNTLDESTMASRLPSAPQPPADAINKSLHILQSCFTDENQFLRARALTAATVVLTCWSRVVNDPTGDIKMQHARNILSIAEHDPENLVRATCLRIVRYYVKMVAPQQKEQLQPLIVHAVSQFLETQNFFEDVEDFNDLIDAVVLTLRDTIMARPDTCLNHNALDVLITLVKVGGAKDSSSTIFIDEAFESAAEAMASLGENYYERFCEKIVPQVTSIMDIEVPGVNELTSLTDVSISVLRILAEMAQKPLGTGFVAHTLPRLYRLILSDADFYQRQVATSAIRFMVVNDKDAVFTYVDTVVQKNGLVMCFDVIGLLLGPNVADADAAEVGELAVTIIEQAGSSALGSSLNELLQVVINRLAIATHHDLIQSLSMVFARLAIINAQEIINFLVDNSKTEFLSLNVVLQKWLESAGHFVGFDTIRQNAQALVRVYQLHDPRVESVIVAGDLVPDNDTRIKTRSMAKSKPIRYTQVSATLKIIKILVAELLPYGDANSAFPPQTPLGNQALQSPGLPRRVDSDDGWESENDSVGATFGKSTDDETQAYLVQFFQAEGANGRFQEIFGQLSEQERKRCMDAVEQHNNALAALHRQQ